MFLVADTAQAPAYATVGAAGLDLRSAVDVRLEPGERCSVSTGISVALPPGHEGQVRPRSGLALKHGIGMVNAPGTIDEDYRGVLHVILINLGQEAFDVRVGDRIAQLVVAPVVRVSVIQVRDREELGSTERDQAGFGSTGVR